MEQLTCVLTLSHPQASAWSGSWPHPCDPTCTLQALSKVASSGKPAPDLCQTPSHPPSPEEGQLECLGHTGLTKSKAISCASWGQLAKLSNQFPLSARCG